jgi:outer membrane receptor protein involved in Fe transport
MRSVSTTTALRAALLASIAVPALGLASAAAAQSMVNPPVTAPPANQPAEATPEAVEEEVTGSDLIVVTASKRAATLQDTPISVAVTSRAQIEQSQIRDIRDLSTLVPSLRVSQLQSSANTNFIIRGFGNGANNVGIEPSVGVFIDGVYRSRSAAQIADLPALQRVEVLRGPQSTLFGKNASAGVISIITEAPQFDLGGNAEFSYGNFNAFYGKAYVTGPITDKLAFSIAGNFNFRDGYAFDENLDTDFNNRNRWGTRGQLLFNPSDTMQLRLIADYDKIDENCCIAANIVNGPTGAAIFALGGAIDPQDPYSYIVYNNYESTNKIANWGVSLEWDWNINDDLNLTTIGAYRNVNSKTNQDSDFTSADLIGSNAADVNINTWTAEVRLASSFDGPLNFLAGVFYFNEGIDQESQLTFGDDFRNYANILSGGNYSAFEVPLGYAPGTFGAAGQGRFENFTLNNQAVSIFGQVDWEPIENLTLTAGGNYTWDRKQATTNNTSTDVFSAQDWAANGTKLFGIPAAFNNLPSVNPLLGLRALQFLPPFLNYPNSVENGETADNNFSYTLRASYRFSSNFSTYFTYATGFKASSFNISADSRPFPADYIPRPPLGPQPPSPIKNAGLEVPNLTTGTRYAGPENAEVFELGFKGQWESFAFNLAIFQQSLYGFQSNIFTGTGFVLGNAEQQSVKGFELDTTINPTDGLTFNFAFTYLDPLFNEFTGGSAFNAQYATVPTDLSGATPAGISPYSLSLGGTYEQNVSDMLAITYHADFNYESPTAIAQGAPTITREVLDLNASLTFTFNDGPVKGLSVIAWGRNLLDAQYLTAIFGSVAQAGSVSGYPSQPRTYGLTALYRF